MRDISEMPIFMLKIDKDSHSPLREDPPEEMLLASGKKSSNSSKSSSGSKRVASSNYRIQKRKLKNLAEEFLNARI